MRFVCKRSVYEEIVGERIVSEWIFGKWMASSNSGWQLSYSGYKLMMIAKI